MKAIFDVTPVFWELVDSIISLDYDTFTKTELYDTIHRCVVMEHGYVLDIDDTTTLIHNDVNALFYDTLSFLQTHEPYSKRCKTLESAVTIIRSSIATIDMTNAFSSLNL